MRIQDNYLSYQLTNTVKLFSKYIDAYTIQLLFYTEELKVCQNENNWELQPEKVWTIPKAINLLLRSVFQTRDQSNQ